jgi:hypothetical protein
MLNRRRVVSRLETIVDAVRGRAAIVVVGVVVVATLAGYALLRHRGSAEPVGLQSEQTERTQPTRPAPPTTQPRQSARRAEDGPVGYPDASSTGVPPDIDLTPYTGPCDITVSGTTIDSKAITCALTINAPNVSIINSSLVASADSVVTFHSVAGVITDSDVSCRARAGSNAIDGSGYTARRVHLHDCENGINGGSNYTIADSLIDQLRAAGKPHYDGIQNDGGSSNVLIRHNTIIAPSEQTGAIMNDNCFGPLSNVVVDGNRLIGGGYTIYVDGSFGPGQDVCKGGGNLEVTITNNRFGNYVFGSALIRGDATVTQSNNVDDATGAPITL